MVKLLGYRTSGYGGSLLDPRLECRPVNQDTRPRIIDKSHLAEIGHVMGDNLTGAADVLRNQLVSERKHAHPAVGVGGTEAIGEPDQGAGNAAQDPVGGETLDAPAEFGLALD